MLKSTIIAVAIAGTLGTFGFAREAAADLRPGGTACLTNARKVYEIKASQAQQAATPLGRAIKASLAIKWRDDTYRSCIAAYT